MSNNSLVSKYLRAACMGLAMGVLVSCAGSVDAPKESSVDNALTAQQREQGWRLLFDGKTFENWRNPLERNPPSDSWDIQNGTIHARSKPRVREDLFTSDAFENFELAFDWRITPGGNSGIKYRIQDIVFMDESKHNMLTKFEAQVGREMKESVSSRETLGPNANSQEYVIGFEYQLIDDVRHLDALRGGTHTTGALYDIASPTEKAGKPAGEWNTSRLIVRGDQVEHWLNGVRVLETSLASEAVRQAAERRWDPAPELKRLLIEQPKKKTPLCLQNHNDEAWFRNIKIREL